MSITLGIDVAKATFEAVLLLGEKVLHRHFNNNPAGFAALDEWLSVQGSGKTHACLEATGRYGEALATWLHERGHQVSVVNPARIKAYAHSRLSRTTGTPFGRNKTDKLDALLIARFCQSEQPRPFSPLAPELQDLQILVRRFQGLQAMRQQEANRLAELGESVVGESIENHLAYLDAQLKELQARLEQHIAEHAIKAQRDLLVSIPGLGARTAVLLLAELPHLANYTNARQAVAQTGLNPQQHTSGSSVRGKSRLSKTGNAAVRKALYMPALVAIQHNPIIRDLAQRLTAKGKCKMVCIGAAMRKLVHLAYGVLKTGQPFDPLHHQKQLAGA